MSDGCIPAELVRAKGITVGALQVYDILDRLDVWEKGIVQVSLIRLAELWESTPATIARHVRRLVEVGGIEVIYPGRYSGHAAGSANTYRLIHKQVEPVRPLRANLRVANAHPRALPLRAPLRAITSPTEKPAPTRRDGFHPYPCYCETCEARIEAKVDHEEPCPPSV